MIDFVGTSIFLRISLWVAMATMLFHIAQTSKWWFDDSLGLDSVFYSFFMIFPYFISFSLIFMTISLTMGWKA